MFMYYVLKLYLSHEIYPEYIQKVIVYKDPQVRKGVI